MTKNFEYYYDFFDEKKHKQDEERIIHLIRYGKTEELKKLVERGVFLNFLVDCNDGFFSPVAEAYMQHEPECAKILLAAGGLPMYQDFDWRHSKVFTIRQIIDGKAPFKLRYSGEAGQKWEEVAAIEADLYPELKEETNGLQMARKRADELPIAAGIYEDGAERPALRKQPAQEKPKDSPAKQEQSAKKGKILKAFDLSKKARILDEDKEVTALRRKRESVLEAATAGIKDEKQKLAIRRKTNVQDLRDKEAKARAARLSKLLKGQQAGE